MFAAHQRVFLGSAGRLQFQEAIRHAKTGNLRRATASTMPPAAPGFQGKTEPDLASWLASFGIDTTVYGRESAKPLALLLEEVEDGETELTVAGGEPLRLVSVINVTLKNSQGRSLFEARQVLPTGVVRPRGLPLSEKMLPGERWQAAVVRGIAEELGPALPVGHSVQIDEASYRQEVEEKESISYPGLRSRYVCHRVDARVEGLPDGDFVTAEERADSMVLQHCWEWR